MRGDSTSGRWGGGYGDQHTSSADGDRDGGADEDAHAYGDTADQYADRHAFAAD